MLEKRSLSFQLKSNYLKSIVNSISEIGLALKSKVKFVVLFLFLSLIWLPLAFLNFDSHHDGLILSTVRLTKQSLLNGGEYPFNQYGPFWATPFLVISFLTSDEYLFLAMRFLTIGFYLISSLILFKSSKLFLTRNAWIPPALFLASQPFVADIGSDLVPWPSAVAMPLILLLFHNALLCLKAEEKIQHPFLLGFLIPLILFTRFQVGVLSLTGVLLVLLYCHKKRIYLGFLFGLTASFLITFLSLLRLGWLSSALYDELVFGLTYLSADKSTFPRPIFTFIGIVLVVSALSCLSSMRANTLSLSKRGKYLIFLIASTALAFFIYVIWTRDLNFLSIQVLITRRIWIVLTLGTLTYYLLKTGLDAVRSSSGFRVFLRIHKETIVLLIFAVVMQSQAYPLFDQMHFWWGSPISFLVVTLVVRNLASDIKVSHRIKRYCIFLLTFLLTFSLIVPWFNQITKQKVEYPSVVGAKIYSKNSAALEQKQLQIFFRVNMDAGSSILNLCDDTNVFFSAPKYIPASRFFVFWAEQMSHTDVILGAMRDSSPDYIVSCDLTHAPALRFQQEKIRDQIVESFGQKITLSATFLGPENKKWFIYQVSNK